MINRSSVFTPTPGTTIGVHVTDMGQTTHNWQVKLERGLWIPDAKKNWSLRLEGQLLAAGPMPGIDQRLDNQRASISRLLEHLKTHCPAYQVGGKCAHPGTE